MMTVVGSNGSYSAIESENGDSLKNNNTNNDDNDWLVMVIIIMIMVRQW